MSEALETRSRRVYWFWLAAFLIGTFGSGIFARAVGLSSFWSMMIMIPPMLLLFPMIRSIKQMHLASGGIISAAITNYNRRMLTWTFAYMASLFGAITVYNALKPTGPFLWLIAVLPALPIIYFVWALGRYLVEETDEYLRMRQVTFALFATGWLLVLATIWGFLETFKVVPHVPSWAVIPVWAIGLGVAQIWSAVRRA